MKKTIVNLVTFKLYIILCFFTISSCKNQNNKAAPEQKASPKWINMDEDENYTPRHECSFVQAGDKFIMFGGRESAKKLDIYDFKSNTWKKGQSIAPKEFNHFQATFHKGFVWIIGAFKTNKFPKEIPEDNIWLYHPPTDKWIQGPEIPEDRKRGGAGLIVYNNKFYLVGGNTIGHDGGFVNWFDEYNPKTNTWTVLENASQARDHFSAVIIDNILYAVGGRHSGGEGGVFAPLVDPIDIYNFDTKKWSVLNTKLPTPRAAPSVAVFNNELLVMGGEGELKGPAYKLVEAYNPNTKKWSQKPDMNYPRHGTQAIVSGKGIYIAGGSPNRGGGNQLNMEVYNEHTPQGDPITASHLETPNEVIIAHRSTQNIVIKNTGGNSGSFINSIKLIGANANTFRINQNVDFTLMDANSELTFEVKHSSNTTGETALLQITYNGDIQLLVKLISE